MDERKIEMCLFSKWNRAISALEAQHKMQRLLFHRKPHRLFFDLRLRLEKGGGSKVPHSVFITTCAILCRRKETEEEIFSALQAAHMEQMLFVGFRMFLCNKSRATTINIQWSKPNGANQYARLSHWFGEFLQAEHFELRGVVRILYRIDSQKLWKIAKEDPNDLLLLTWLDTLGRLPSSQQALELLDPEQSERRQALAFWWLTRPIQQSSSSDENVEIIMQELKDIPSAVLVPRIYEFILSEKNSPRAFLSYLIRPAHSLLLQKEINNKEKIVRWREATAIVALIVEVKAKRKRKSYMKILLSAIEEKIRAGNFDYNNDESQDFLSRLPVCALAELQQTLSCYANTLHTAQIDSIIRPHLYQKDVIRLATLQNILDYSPVTSPVQADNP